MSSKLTYFDELLKLDKKTQYKYFSGSVCLFKNVSTMYKGQHFGEISIMTNQRRGATIVS